MNPIARIVEHNWLGCKDVPLFEHGIQFTTFSFGIKCILKHPVMRVPGIRAEGWPNTAPTKNEGGVTGKDAQPYGFFCNLHDLKYG